MGGVTCKRGAWSSVKKTFVLFHADSMFLRVCVCLTWPLTGLGSLVMKRASGNRCVPADGTLPFDWLPGPVLQAGWVILDL